MVGQGRYSRLPTAARGAAEVPPEPPVPVHPILASASPWAWGGFLLFVLGMLALDLGVFHRHGHVVRPREALVWSLVWVSLALVFNAGVWRWMGGERGLEFLSGYPVKSARRGDLPEAISFYQAFVLRPLVEVLRIRHDPWRHDFDVRYLRHDLPEPARSRLFALWTVRDAEDLLRKRDEAEAWFREEIRSIDPDSIRLE